MFCFGSANIRLKTNTLQIFTVKCDEQLEGMKIKIGWNSCVYWGISIFEYGGFIYLAVD